MSGGRLRDSGQPDRDNDLRQSHNDSACTSRLRLEAVAALRSLPRRDDWRQKAGDRDGACSFRASRGSL